MLMAAGGVAFEAFSRAPRWRAACDTYRALIAVVGMLTLPFGVPVLPVETFLGVFGRASVCARSKDGEGFTAQLPQNYCGYRSGWDNIAIYDGARVSVRCLQERDGCAILAGNYGEAGAIDYYGPMLGLPKAISAHNSLF